LDDAESILPEQLANLFQTKWESGLTEDIALAVEKHLNEEAINNLADRVSLPTQAARPGPDNRGKPRLLDLERRILARDRFAPDSPLEEDGFELLVPSPRTPRCYIGGLMPSFSA